MVSFMLQPLYAGSKSPYNHRAWCSLGPKAWKNVVQPRIICIPYLDLNHNSPVIQSTVYSLYWLSYLSVDGVRPGCSVEPLETEWRMWNVKCSWHCLSRILFSTQKKMEAEGLECEMWNAYGIAYQEYCFLPKKNGGRRFLWNIVKFLPEYKSSQLRRQSSL